MKNDYATKSDIKLIAKDIEYIKLTLERYEKMIVSISDKLKSDYVTQIEFIPIKNIVTGMVAIILVEVLGIVLFVVLNK